MKRKTWLRYFGIIFFILIFLGTRVPRLHNDIFSTDAVYWHHRSENFINALNEKDYRETYQKYHPGVTLMWTTGLTAELVSNAYDISIENVFSATKDFHFRAKLTLVFWQLILSVAAIYLLSQIFDFNKAVFMMTLLVLEPFYIGNSRLLHLDAQISLYFIIGLALSYLSIKKKGLLYPIFT